MNTPIKIEIPYIYIYIYIERERERERERESLYCYHDTHLETSILQVRDIFRTTQKTCIEHYKIDPAYFYTTSGLA